MNASATMPVTRRSARDWVLDSGAFLLAALYWVLAVGGRLEAAYPSTPQPAWWFSLDVVAGALAVAALWLRRRWPLEVALALVVLSALSEMAGGAMLVALFTVAVQRPPRTTAVALASSLLAALVDVVLHPRPGTSGPWLLLLDIAVQGGVVGWGLFVRHRRQLVLSLRERAAQVRTEEQLRAEQAQHHAREEIAREMHDVLGHRLSLLSVHAGALEFRPDAPAEEVTRAAKVIRESAHQALQDLREIVGVLRAPVGELPQPTLADLPLLVEESARAQMQVDLRTEVREPVPDSTGRTAYRIVQEALTNARKHAPGTAVQVRLAGTPGQGLTVEVDNAAPATGLASTTAATPAPPGRGLIGLAERVALADGRLEHGPTPDGGWRLAAWLPWPP